MRVPANWTTRLDVFRWTEQGDPTPALRVRYDLSYYYRRQPGILLMKSPHNAVRARWLQQHFQPSRFLAIVRSPYAVCEGIRRRRGHTIETAATHWVRANEILLADVAHLDRCLLLSYETLCARPEEHLDRIERFLDLDVPFNRSILETPISARNIDGVPRVIQDFNGKSLERLSPTDVEAVNRIAGTLMYRLGYQRLQKHHVDALESTIMALQRRR